MASLDQVIGQMIAADMPPLPSGHPVATGKIVRFGPKKKAWYILHEYLGRTGKRHLFGAFGIWRGAESNTIKIESDTEGMDPAEAERLKRSQAELEARETAKRAERARFAANRAISQWNDARATGESPYLKRKGVDLEKGLRVTSDGTLLVPMVRYDVTEADAADPAEDAPRRLVGLQKIAPDGSKLFNKGMAKVGAACRLGREPKDGELIILTEGAATALSIRKATGSSRTVFIAFDAGNLLAVARILRKLYPASPMLFCADDDAYLEAQLNKRLRGDHDVTELYTVGLGGKPLAGKLPVCVRAEFRDDDLGVPVLIGAIEELRAEDTRMIPFACVNAGRTKANAASSEVANACVCWPRFVKRELSPDPDQARLTDFNDLQQTEGLASVEKQLIGAIDIAMAGSSNVLRPDFGKGKSKRERKGAQSAAGSASPPQAPAQPSLDWKEFFERFVLIYPTDTAWDARYEKIVKVSAMKLAFGEGAVKYWLQNPDRRTVNADDVVFDPTGTCDPKRCVNLFRGMRMKPSREGSCKKLLELLQFLCGEAGQDQTPVTDWVLNWISYPLQHPGAKMQTAVVMHGQLEGTGKNLFWGAIRDIFVPYGSLITQSELESPYNAWISQKLFMIANEVISRQELRHHVGRLKNLITESPLPIREIYMPVRYEANHMNMVFLTNELHALQIAPGDRRYLIVRTPTVGDKSYYLDVVAEKDAGGVPALLQYLLDRDLGDFNEHTKPLMTQAKEDLAEMGLSSVQFFWYQHHDGELGLPYQHCWVRDLYSVYAIWCPRVGIRNPVAENVFSHQYKEMNGVRRIKDRVPNLDTGELQDVARKSDYGQRRVFVVGERPKSDLEFWAKLAEFRAAAREFAKDDTWRLNKRESRGGDGRYGSDE